MAKDDRLPLVAGLFLCSLRPSQTSSFRGGTLSSEKPSLTVLPGLRCLGSVWAPLCPEGKALPGGWEDCCCAFNSTVPRCPLTAEGRGWATLSVRCQFCRWLAMCPGTSHFFLCLFSHLKGVQGTWSLELWELCLLVNTRDVPGMCVLCPPNAVLPEGLVPTHQWVQGKCRLQRWHLSTVVTSKWWSRDGNQVCPSP